MSKTANVSSTRTIRISVSEQSEALLNQLAAKGIYGRNVADVAGRFVDGALQRLAPPPRLRIPGINKARQNR
jgi:hypothetical protein